jgi:hypothetical protein
VAQSFGVAETIDHRSSFRPSFRYSLVYFLTLSVDIALYFLCLLVFTNDHNFGMLSLNQ